VNNFSTNSKMVNQLKQKQRLFSAGTVHILIVIYAFYLPVINKT